MNVQIQIQSVIKILVVKTESAVLLVVWQALPIVVSVNLFFETARKEKYRNESKSVRFFFEQNVASNTAADGKNEWSMEILYFNDNSRGSQRFSSNRFITNTNRATFVPHRSFRVGIWLQQHIVSTNNIFESKLRKENRRSKSKEYFPL